jgi:hypothetical protein
MLKSRRFPVHQVTKIRRDWHQAIAMIDVASPGHNTDRLLRLNVPVLALAVGMGFAQASIFRWPVAALNSALEVDLAREWTGLTYVACPNPAQVMAVTPPALARDRSAALNRTLPWWRCRADCPMSIHLPSSFEAPVMRGAQFAGLGWAVTAFDGARRVSPFTELSIVVGLTGATPSQVMRVAPPAGDR